MIKFKQGSVTNINTGEVKDIVVKSVTPNRLRDILIGGGVTLLGIVYLTTTAFKNGSRKFEEAEMKALSDADLLLNINLTKD